MQVEDLLVFIGLSLVLPLSFIVVGTIFIYVGKGKRQLYNDPKYIYSSTAELLSFREYLRTGYRENSSIAVNDYEYNKAGTKPLVRFIENGETIQDTMEFSTSELNKNDIGRMIPVICFSNDERKVSRIILDTDEQKKMLKSAADSIYKRNKRMGYFFIGLGLLIIVMILFALIKWL